MPRTSPRASQSAAIQARAEVVCDTLDLPIDMADGIADELHCSIQFCHETGVSPIASVAVGRNRSEPGAERDAPPDCTAATVSVPSGSVPAVNSLILMPIPLPHSLRCRIIQSSQHRRLEPKMFHTYIRTAAKTSVDVDRASFLMDSDLRQRSADWVFQNEDMLRERGVSSIAQAFWDYYCQRHREKYGEPFGPDVIPGWDQ